MHMQAWRAERLGGGVVRVTLARRLRAAGAGSAALFAPIGWASCLLLDVSHIPVAGDDIRHLLEGWGRWAPAHPAVVLIDPLAPARSNACVPKFAMLNSRDGPWRLVQSEEGAFSAAGERGEPATVVHRPDRNGQAPGAAALLPRHS